MMNEYISFLQKLFPAIDPYTAQQAKNAVKEFARYGEKTPFFTEPLDKDFQQGDIFSKVPFVYVDRNGQVQLAEVGGMLLTNPCDATRNELLQFAAVTPLESYSANPRNIVVVTSNINYQYLYFPDTKLHDSFVNLGLITSISRESFEGYVAAGKSERKVSLNLTGYFLFITKLTVFFMRPEDREVLISRDCGTAS